VLVCTPFSTASVSSTFDTGLDGWTLTGSGKLSFQSAGGHPGSFARYDDIAGTGGDGWIIAPAKFLGNWKPFDKIGSLAWDHIILQTGGAPEILKASVTISGPDGSATWSSPTYLTTTWQTFSAPITQTAWKVSGSWDNLLANVTTLKIRIEACHNGGPSLDIDSIDNITLIPEPATIFFLTAHFTCRFFKRRTS
jgi:hypothetical protein